MYRERERERGGARPRRQGLTPERGWEGEREGGSVCVRERGGGRGLDVKARPPLTRPLRATPPLIGPPRESPPLDSRCLLHRRARFYPPPGGRVLQRITFWITCRQA